MYADEVQLYIELGDNIITFCDEIKKQVDEIC